MRNRFHTKIPVYQGINREFLDLMRYRLNCMRQTSSRSSLGRYSL